MVSEGPGRFQSGDDVSSVWPKVGQTKQCLEWPSTTISAHTARQRPVPDYVPGLVDMENLPAA